MNRSRHKQGARHSGFSIVGDRITVEEAAVISGLTLPEVMRLYRKRKIFGIYEGGILYLSPAVLDELRALALLSRPHSPIRQPEFFAGGIA